MAESPQPESNILTCSICFQELREPVCTTCGHLFCWPCLHTWVDNMRNRACPMCRVHVTLEANVIPIYIETRAEPSQGTAAPTSTTTPPRPRADARPAPSATAQSNITPAETQQAAMAESPQPESNILPPWGCSICFQELREPVCTTCGHLFCWPCLYNMRNGACPMCRAPVTLEANVIPIYVETRAEPSPGAAAPPSTTTPPRPHAGARPAPSATAQSSNITPTETQWPGEDRNRVPAPSATALSYNITPGESQWPWEYMNRVQLHRERLSRVQESEQADEADERAFIARMAARNEGLPSSEQVDYRSLFRASRELVRMMDAASARASEQEDAHLRRLFRVSLEEFMRRS